MQGHQQVEVFNEVIERQVKRLLKSGPMFETESFITAIRAAKKTGETYKVKDCDFEFFYNIKLFANEIGPMIEFGGSETF